MYQAAGGKIMNILIINGSPRGSRSNSLRLTKDFVDGICESVVKEHGETPDITEITVNDMDIR